MLDKIFKKSTLLWNPVYQLNSSIIRSLMDIEGAKAVFENTSLSTAYQADLRQTAMICSAHYTTRIEGNSLTIEEAQKVIIDQKLNFYEREKDVNEVRNCWNALLKVEDLAVNKVELTEKLICILQAYLETGEWGKPTPYRDGQNAIRDVESGSIIYLPPQAKDVSELMAEMVAWALNAQKEGVAPPVIAALLQYQLVIIQPFYSGNRRLGRLLSSFILLRDGYGLNGLLSLEEQYAKDIEAYYRALTVHKHHNYYHGLVEEDLTFWIEYFVKLLAKAFCQTRDEALQTRGVQAVSDKTLELRRLDQRAKAIIAIFAKQDRITVKEISYNFRLSNRMARLLAAGWVKDGLLVILNKSNRARVYGLAKKYEKLNFGNNCQ